MLPFRELESFDAFTLDGRECEKVGSSKYLTYDELGEPHSLEAADPNLMVEFVDDEEGEEAAAVEKENEFFHMLLNFFDIMEQSGEEMTIEGIRQFAEDFLSMPEDD